MKRNVVVLALALASAAAASCSSSSNTLSNLHDPGGACKSISECAISESCAFGFCTVSCTPTTGCAIKGAAGPVCQICYNKTQVCCPASGCPRDSNTNEVCETGEGGECHSDADCPPGLGLACHTANDAYVFSCVTACTAGSKCPKGESCNTTYGVCTPSSSSSTTDAGTSGG